MIPEMENYPPVKVLVLGSGTSTGIPAIGCNCPVCTSDDPRNKRLRSSIRIQTGGRTLLVDCGVDFRQQMLRHRTPHIDGVLVTHTHADHIHGLDDLRAFTFRRESPMPIYSSEGFIRDIELRFGYCFNPMQIGGGVPKISLNTVMPGQPFDVGGVPVVPLPIMHGRLPILGFRLGSFAYMTDCSGIPEETWPLLEGVRTLIISGLRHEPHPTHFTLAESMDAARRIGVERVYFIHMTCRLDHAKTEETLPEWARLTYDGMEIEVP